MSYKIRELKQALVEQNGMITNLRDRDEKSRQAVSSLYSILAKYKPEYQAGALAVEDPSLFPDIRHEDIARSQQDELVLSIRKVFGAILESNKSLRADLKEIYKEMDDDLGSALEDWNRIKATEGSARRKDAFREGLLSPPQTERSRTPETPNNANSNLDNSRTPGLSTPETPNAENKRKGQTGKSKGGTTTLGGLFQSPSSPTTDKARSKQETKSKADN